MSVSGLLCDRNLKYKYECVYGRVLGPSMSAYISTMNASHYTLNWRFLKAKLITYSYLYTTHGHPHNIRQRSSNAPNPNHENRGPRTCQSRRSFLLDHAQWGESPGTRYPAAEKSGKEYCWKVGKGMCWEWVFELPGSYRGAEGRVCGGGEEGAEGG